MKKIQKKNKRDKEKAAELKKPKVIARDLSERGVRRWKPSKLDLTNQGPGGVEGQASQERVKDDIPGADVHQEQAGEQGEQKAQSEGEYERDLGKEQGIQGEEQDQLT